MQTCFVFECPGRYKQRDVDYESTGSEFTLPAHYYRSEDIYRQEIDRIFTKRWLMACREEELAEPGDYITVPVGPEVLGRMTNLLGDPIDEKGPIKAKLRRPIHRHAPGSHTSGTSRPSNAPAPTSS